MKSTVPHVLLAGLLLACLSGCGETPESSSPSPAKRRKSFSDKPLHRSTKPEATPRELSFKLLPRLVRGRATGTPGTTGLLGLSADLGLRVDPVFRGAGTSRTPTPKELDAILALGEPLEAVYRRNLLRLAAEASLRAIGTGEHAQMLYLDTDLPGIESIVLLPEIWDRARTVLGQEPALALPDRGHCRFLRAKIGSVQTAMAKDFVRWNTDASEPLAPVMIRRKGTDLVAGRAFTDLVTKSKDDD